MTLSEYLQAKRKLVEAATKVVAWYSHGAGDSTHSGLGTVRGPYNRWFQCSGVSPEYKEQVASVEADCEYAAEAMNEWPKTLEALTSFADALKLARAQPDMPDAVLGVLSLIERDIERILEVKP